MKLLKWIIEKIMNSNAFKEAANEYLESIWSKESFDQFVEVMCNEDDIENDDFWRGVEFAFNLMCDWIKQIPNN